MPPLPRPHRTTFLPPIITLAQGEARARIFGELFAQIVFGRLVAHPVVAATDPDDRVFLDGNGFVLDANHPDFGDLLAWEHRTARREEVAWLELTLVPGATAMPRLHARGADGAASVFSEGGGTLGGGLEGAIAAWLDARGLPAGAPLASFSADELRAVAAWLDGLIRQAGDPDAEATILTSPPVPALAAAGLRALGRLAATDGELRRHVDDLVLEADPDDVIAQQHQLARRAAAGETARFDARRLVAAAPQWSKPHLLAALDAPVDVALRHAGLAVTLAPESPQVAESWSAALLGAGRPEDAARAALRGIVLAPSHLPTRNAHVRALRAAGRAGDAFREARQTWTGVSRQLDEAWLRRDDPHVRRAAHLLAAVHVDVGRLGEALAIAGDVSGAGFAAERAELEAWRHSPELLAAAYAREGATRRDPARVLDGFGRGRTLDARDVGLLIDALLATGQDELAAIVYRREEGAGRATGALAWLAGARAQLVAGELEPAVALLQRVALRGGAERTDGAMVRLLRLLPARPLAEHEAILAEQLDTGATTLARLYARDVADFVDGAAGSVVVARALGPRDRRPFDDAWLAPLAESLRAAPLDAVRALFARAGSTLADGDRLVGHWLDAISLSAPDEVRAGQLAFSFASALARYLVASTGQPSPFLGGLRAVAVESLALLERHAPLLPLGALRSLLEALEAAAPGVDPWLFDRWLLRVERALDIDGRVAHLAPFTNGLSAAADALRGPERVAFELRLAEDLKDDGDPTNDDQARVLYERSLRACGTGEVAAGWSEVTTGMTPAASLDLLATAAAAEPFLGAPRLALGRALLAAGHVERAFEALVAALPRLDATTREQRLAELAPLWSRAAIDVPFDWTAAQDEGLAHLEAGRAARAARCFRWCNAVDPGNAGMLKNLGLACAALGRAGDAVAAFSEMDETDGAKLAGHALLQASRPREAVAVLRAALLGSTSGVDFAQLGAAAWYAEDDEAACEAFERAYALRDGKLAVEELDPFARALASAGRHERAEAIARQMFAAAGEDLVWRARAGHALARALLGQGRVVEAVPAAQQALADDPAGDEAAAVAETLSRATHGEPITVETPRATPAARAFAALAAGEVRAAASIAGGGAGWQAARAALAAASFRTDALTPGAYGALQLAAAHLDASAGATDVDPLLWRCAALALREDAHFPTDTPPPLGPRMEKAELERLLADRVEDDEPTIMKELPSVPTQREPPLAGADDLMVFPGTKIPRLSDYVQVMKAMQGQDPLGTLARLGLDMDGYAQLASAWGQRLAADPTLSARFSAKMSE